MSTPHECAATFFKILKSILVSHLGLQSVTYRVETPCTLDSVQDFSFRLDNQTKEQKGGKLQSSEIHLYLSHICTIRGKKDWAQFFKIKCNQIYQTMLGTIFILRR